MPTPQTEHFEIAIAFIFVFLTVLTLLKSRWIRNLLLALVTLVSIALVALFGIHELAVVARHLWQNFMPGSTANALAMATAFKLALLTHTLPRA